MNETDATGTVTVTVNGVDYNATVINGYANVTVGVLDQNATEYRFTAVYNGDDKYNTTDVAVNATVAVAAAVFIRFVGVIEILFFVASNK